MRPQISRSFTRAGERAPLSRGGRRATPRALARHRRGRMNHGESRQRAIPPSRARGRPRRRHDERRIAFRCESGKTPTSARRVRARSRVATRTWTLDALRAATEPVKVEAMQAIVEVEMWCWCVGVCAGMALPRPIARLYRSSEDFHPRRQLRFARIGAADGLAAIHSRASWARFGASCRLFAHTPPSRFGTRSARSSESTSWRSRVWKSPPMRSPNPSFTV